MAGSVTIGDLVFYLRGKDQDFSRTLDNGAKRAAEFGKGLQTAAASARRMGIAITAMGAAITGALGLMIKGTGDFQQSIANAGAVAGKTGDDLERAKEQMTELAETLGETTVFSATEAAEAFYNLASRGFDVAAMSVEELEPLLNIAAATQTDLSKATEIVTASLKTFRLGNEEMVRVADVFVTAIGSSAATMDRLQAALSFAGPVASAFGKDIESTTAILSKLFDVGFDGSRAGTALVGMFNRLANASKPASDALESYGLTLEDVNPKMHSMVDILKTLKDAGLSTGDALKVFGQRAGPAVLALLDMSNAGTEALDAITELEKKLGDDFGSSARVAGDQLNTLNGRLKLLTSQLDSLAKKISTPLLETLEIILDVTNNLLAMVNALLKQVPLLTSLISHFTAVVGLALLVVGPFVIAMATLATLIVGLNFTIVSTIALWTSFLAAVAAVAAIFSLPVWIGLATTIAAFATGIAMAVAPLVVIGGILATIAGLGIVGGIEEIKATLIPFLKHTRTLFRLFFEGIVEPVRHILIVIRQAFTVLTISIFEEFFGPLLSKSESFGDSLISTLAAVLMTIRVRVEALVVPLQAALTRFLSFVLGTVLPSLHREINAVILVVRGWFLVNGALIRQTVESLRTTFISVMQNVFGFVMEGGGGVWAFIQKVVPLMRDVIIGTIGAILSFVTRAMVFWNTNSVAITEGINNAVNRIVFVIQTAWGVVTSLISLGYQLFLGDTEGAKESFFAILDNALAFISDVLFPAVIGLSKLILDWLAEKIKGFVIGVNTWILDAILSAGGAIANAILVPWKAAINVIIDGLNVVASSLNDVFSFTIPDWISAALLDSPGGKSFSLNLGQIPNIDWSFARGGVATHSGVAMVGESGRELIQVSNGTKVFNNNQTEQMLGGSVSVNLNIAKAVVRTDADIPRIAKELGAQVKRSLRGNGGLLLDRT